MSLSTQLLHHEARLQFRYGIYYAYAFVIAFYVLILWQFSAFIPAWFIGVVIYSDPAVVGFFFLGALMMLEKSEGVRAALGITPMSAGDYFAAKAATLTTMSVVAVILIAFAMQHAVNLLVLLPAVILTSVFYLGLGVLVTRLFATVTAYLMGSTAVLIPIVLPAGLAFLSDMPIWAMLVPTAAQLKLIFMGTGHGSASGIEVAVMLVVSIFSAAVAVGLARNTLRSDFGSV